MKKVLVIGGGYAGARAASLLAREKGVAATLVTAEDRPPYCQHRLPEVVAGRCEPEELALPDLDGTPPGSVRFLPGRRVAEVRPGERKAVLDGGEEIPFDATLVACGGRPWIPGNLREAACLCDNVYPLKRMAQATILRRAIREGARRVAIIGAGRIGLLLAEALAESAVRLTVVDLAPEILPTMLHGDVAARLRRAYDGREGLAFRLGVPVRALETEGSRARAVVLEDGNVVPCDAVVVATGVEGGAEFLSGAFPGYADGIPVNDRMETGLDGIYAAGDAVRFRAASGREEPGQLILNARIQAEVAVEGICGRAAAAPPLFIGNVLKAGARIAARVGDIDAEGSEDLRIGRSFARLSLDGGGVTGLQFAGDPEDLRGVCATVLKRFPADGIAPALRSGMRLGVPAYLSSQGTRWG